MDERTDAFNIVDEPWIWAISLAGERAELSLSEIFHKAAKLKALANDIPTQDFAILRVLEAILQRSIADRVYDYDTPAEMWGELWSQKTLPLDEIDDYLEEWHDRFNLFDDERPFMQVAGMRATNGSVSEIKKLIADVPDGLPLFSLRSGKGLETLTYSEAARWLVHVHAFDVAGIKTGVVGDKTAKGGKSYPIGTGWAGSLGGVCLEGSSLAETILLNLCLCEDCRDDPETFPDVQDDLPAWEQGQKVPGDEGRPPIGYADTYTWQSRRVLLQENSGVVNGVVLTNGNKLEAHNERAVEPMTSWRRSIPQEKKLKISPVYLPRTHQTGRAMWRGLSSLLPNSATGQSGESIAPGVVLWAGYLASLNGGRVLSPTYPIRLHATGFEYGVQNSVIAELIDDKLSMTAYLLTPEGASAVVLAEECMGNTDKAVVALGTLAVRIRLASGMDSLATDGVRNAAKAEAYYELDGPFRAWLSRLSELTLSESKKEWNMQARNIIGKIGRRIVEASDSAAIYGRRIEVNKKEEWMSASKAEASFWYSLNKILEYEKPADTKKDEVM